MSVCDAVILRLKFYSATITVRNCQHTKTRQTMYVYRNIEARSRIIVTVKKQCYIFVCLCARVDACMCICARVWVPGRVGVCMRARARSLDCPACDILCRLLWPLAAPHFSTFICVTRDKALRFSETSVTVYQSTRYNIS